MSEDSGPGPQDRLITALSSAVLEVPQSQGNKILLNVGIKASAWGVSLTGLQKGESQNCKDTSLHTLGGLRVKAAGTQQDVVTKASDG